MVLFPATIVGLKCPLHGEILFRWQSILARFGSSCRTPRRSSLSLIRCRELPARGSPLTAVVGSLGHTSTDGPSRLTLTGAPGQAPRLPKGGFTREEGSRLEKKGKLAERVGFEPTDPVKDQRFSRPPRSTTPAPLRMNSRISGMTGGEGGIRTLGRVSPTHAFQACSFSHSDTSPFLPEARSQRSRPFAS